MSSSAQANTKQQIQEKQGGDNTPVEQQLISQVEPFIENALPQEIGKERFMNVCLTTLRQNPDLLKCDRSSLLGSMLESAQLGLTPNTLGQCYIIPYGDEAQLVIGYRGMIDLARRSGDVEAITSRVIYENDDFEINYGHSNPVQNHSPYWQQGETEKGDIVAVYARVDLAGGGVHVEIMPKQEIDEIKSQHGNTRSGSPWDQQYEEMAKKTVVRRAFKYLPVSTEAQRAAEVDEQTVEFEQQAGEAMTQIGESNTVEQDGKVIDEQTGEVVGESDKSSDQPQPQNYENNYRDAQAMAKKLNKEWDSVDINAKQSHDDLIQQIDQTLSDIESGAIGSSGNSQGEAKQEQVFN